MLYWVLGCLSPCVVACTIKVAPSFWFLNINMPIFLLKPFPNCLRKTWFKFLGGSPSKCWPNSMPVFVCIARKKRFFEKKSQNGRWHQLFSPEVCSVKPVLAEELKKSGCLCSKYLTSLLRHVYVNRLVWTSAWCDLEPRRSTLVSGTRGRRLRVYVLFSWWSARANFFRPKRGRGAAGPRIFSAAPRFIPRWPCVNRDNLTSTMSFLLSVLFEPACWSLLFFFSALAIRRWGILGGQLTEKSFTCSPSQQALRVSDWY